MVNARRLVHHEVMAATSPPVPPSPSQPPPAPPGRQLRRDREHRVLGGVAAGIARTYGWDVTLVRVLWIVAAVVWIGIPAYLIAWIAIPASGAPSTEDRTRDIGLIAGLVLVGIGAAIAVNQILPHRVHGRFLAPLLLIGGGLALLVLRRPALDADDPPPAVPPAPWASPPSPAPPVDEPAAGDDVVTTETHTAATAIEPPTAWTQTAPWPTVAPARHSRRAERRARRPRPFLAPLALSVLMLGAGVTSLLVATETIDLDVSVAFAVALGFVGSVLAVSAWFGRARSLIALGFVLTLATAASTTIDVPLRGGFGDRTYRPQNIEEVREKYELAAGPMLIDLRGLDLKGDDDVDIDAQVAMGELKVLVPNDAFVDVEARAGAGRIDLFGSGTGGYRIDRSGTTEGDTGVVRLDLRVGAGHIEVLTDAGFTPTGDTR
jgi:phage shock protein PspC (stress-responsive transcriptional regulator)